MAIGDAIGIVHIMEITRHISQNLEREKRSIAEFWQKEEQRVTYYEDRFSIRADEANRMELQGL